MDELLQAQRHASNNRGEIEASKVCGCYFCQQLFPPDEIIAWTGLDMSHFNDADDANAANAANAETALCPRCGSESVLGDRAGYELNPQFLGRMHEAWFQRTIIRRPAPKK